MLHWGVEEGHYTHKLLKKKKDSYCKRWVGLYTGENKRDIIPGEL
jgi:hypothetical protein